MHSTWRRCLAGMVGLTMYAAGDVVAQQEPSFPEPPPITNAVEVSRTLNREYPEGLRAAGIGATVQFRVFINAEGRPDSLRVINSSGIWPLDVATRAALRAARFQPPELEDGAGGAWFEMPVHVNTPPQDAAVPTPPLRDRDAAIAAVMSVAPQDLRRRRIQVPVVVMLDVDDDGAVTHATVADEGCVPAAPRAALEVAYRFVFEPATTSSPTRRRFPATILFSVDTVSLTLPGDADPPPRPRAERNPDVRDGPARRPQLRNTRTIQEALVRRYPPRLRSAGIGGEVVLWMYVDERGRVVRTWVSRSSGYCELDLAGYEIASRMQFNPAVHGGERVPVWVEIPLVFSAR